MANHARRPRRVVDTIAAYLTLAVAFLNVVRNVSAGRHAWKPLPEVDTGATDQFAAVLHGWNADKPTRRFAPVWPSETDLNRVEDTQVLPAVQEVQA